MRIICPHPAPIGYLEHHRTRGDMPMPRPTSSAWRLVVAPCLIALPVVGIAAENLDTATPVAPLPATCMVFTNTVSGTGFVVDRANRLVVTNYHVPDKQTDVTVFFPIYKDAQVITTAGYTW